MTSLEFIDVHASYGPYRALNGVSVSMSAGESVAILGANGVGKSTFVRVASGLLAPTSGVVTVLGSSVAGVSVHDLARRGVVHVPEGVGLFSDLSIEENLYLRIGGRRSPDSRERVSEALEILGPLRERRKVKAGQLSGGQQRLVAVVGALAARPRLLLADEPALGLSPAAAEDVYAALAATKDPTTTLVIVETRLGRVEALCDRSVILEMGSVVYDGLTTGAEDVMAGLLHRTSE